MKNGVARFFNDSLDNSMPKFTENSPKEKDQIRACFAHISKFSTLGGKKKKKVKQIVLGTKK